jgi:hypothetical protein
MTADGAMAVFTILWPISPVRTDSYFGGVDFSRGSTLAGGNANAAPPLSRRLLANALRVKATEVTRDVAKRKLSLNPSEKAPITSCFICLPRFFP